MAGIIGGKSGGAPPSKQAVSKRLVQHRNFVPEPCSGKGVKMDRFTSVHIIFHLAKICVPVYMDY